MEGLEALWLPSVKCCSRMWWAGIAPVPPQFTPWASVYLSVKREMRNAHWRNPLNIPKGVAQVYEFWRGWGGVSAAVSTHPSVELRRGLNVLMLFGRTVN